MSPETQFHRTHLPHFEAGEIPQHICFRLADSLPQPLLREWEEELHCLPKTEQQAQRRDRIEQALDQGLGACWLRRPEIAAMVRDALHHFDGKRYQLHGWVIMPNHVHVLVTLLGNHTLSGIVHSWKSYTANQANKILARSGEFWHEDYFDRFIRTEKHFVTNLNYIHWNPVQAGLCKKPEDWEWSSYTPEGLGGKASSFPRGQDALDPREKASSLPRGQDALDPREKASSLPRGQDALDPREKASSFPRGQDALDPREKASSLPRGQDALDPREKASSLPRGQDALDPREKASSLPRGQDALDPREKASSLPREQDALDPGGTDTLPESSPVFRRTGWETFLDAVIHAGFSITGTWPVRTEGAGRIIAKGTNALASSIVLICRRRPDDAPTASRRDFVAALVKRLGAKAEVARELCYRLYTACERKQRPAETEAAKAADNCLLVISLPASDTASSHYEAAEVGGQRGADALKHLQNVIGRVESAWRPASTEEGFELVRRRLFQPLSGNDAYKHRPVP